MRHTHNTDTLFVHLLSQRTRSKGYKLVPKLANVSRLLSHCNLLNSHYSSIETIIAPFLYFNLCSLLVWTSGMGISCTLILAVILVKLVRIYRIFYLHDNIGKLCSDTALAGYVILLLIPTAIILTVMTVIHHISHPHSLCRSAVCLHGRS